METSSDRESLTSSNYEYKELDGRRFLSHISAVDLRFHGVENTYPLLNDGEEWNRLDEIHNMYRISSLP